MGHGWKKNQGAGEPVIDGMEMVKTLNETDTHRKEFSEPSREGR
jgi:hypothetical protein